MNIINYLEHNLHYFLKTNFAKQIRKTCSTIIHFLITIVNLSSLGIRENRLQKEISIELRFHSPFRKI